MPTHYSRAQIALHWVIFLLIAFQFVANEPMGEAWRAVKKGQEVSFDPLVAAHVFAGIAVLALVVWRLALRLTRGVPPLPAEEPAHLKLVAHLTHWGLYAFMVLVPLSGLVAWFGSVEPAGEAHEVLKTLLMILVILHVAGALYQQLVLKTNIMERMKKAG
ncbi:cytochrome b [Thalassobius vesicularis]|uniref:Cytochrome b n=1 Tax=Thalassobius vesicularis TaxID=1294297 RepID=A0A4S3M8Q9_9RHOB|nr:cytochrome b/b6 domain-containing protein [Thalassobius vesicularis]THD72798.1 cytochrome b [Thalassobius vesicularis]